MFGYLLCCLIVCLCCCWLASLRFLMFLRFVLVVLRFVAVD